VTANIIQHIQCVSFSLDVTANIIHHTRFLNHIYTADLYIPASM